MFSIFILHLQTLFTVFNISSFSRSLFLTTKLTLTMFLFCSYTATSLQIIFLYVSSSTILLSFILSKAIGEFNSSDMFFKILLTLHSWSATKILLLSKLFITFVYCLYCEISEFVLLTS